MNVSRTMPGSIPRQKASNVVWFLIAILAFSIIKHIPPAKDLSTEAISALAVFAVASILWISNAFPIAVTGLVVLLLLPLSGAVTAQEAYSHFGNSAIFFVLGAFILASPVMRSGLSTRMALALITRFGNTPISLVFALFILSSMLSFVLSEHAVAAMLFPITMAIIKAAKEQYGSDFAFGAFLATGWGAIIGGTGTLLGGARAPLALGLLESTTNYSISFVQWTEMVFPIVFLMLILAFISVYLIIRKTKPNIMLAQQVLGSQKAKLGAFSYREALTLGVLCFTIFLWIFYGKRLGLDIVALLGVAIAFALRITRWKEVEQDVQWSIFVMYGSAIALSAVLSSTGAAKAIVLFIMSTGIQDPFIILAILTVLATILTELMSNAAAVAVLMPIALILAQQYHIDPRAISVLVATAAGLTFLLPVSTPAMAIITSTPFVPPFRAMRWGIALKLATVIIILWIAKVYWPMIGLSI